jgi:diguanylate cyclase (GGDEF)-like protein
MSQAVPLSTSLRVVQTLLQRSPDPAVLFDHQLRTVYLNEPLAELLGMPQAEPTDAADAAALFGRMLAEPISAVEQAQASLTGGRQQRVSLSQTAGALTEALLELTFIPLVEQSNQATALAVWLRQLRVDPSLAEVASLRLPEEQAKSEELARRLERKKGELALAMDRLAKLSRTDSVTGLLNRAAFSEIAEEALKLASRHRRNAAVLVCEIDGLKPVTERRGYTAADSLLSAVGKAISSGLRSSDLVARIGSGAGDFVVLLAETTVGGVAEAAARCCRAVSELSAEAIGCADPQPPRLNVGVAVLPQDGDTVEELMSRASTALQRTQGKGGGAVARSSGGMGGGGERALVAASVAPAVLLVDIDPERAHRCAERAGQGFEFVVAESADKALTTLNYRGFDAIVACQDVGGEGGQQLLEKALARVPSTARLLLVADETDFLKIAASDSAHAHRLISMADYPEQLADALEETLLLRRLGDSRQLSVAHALTTVGGVQAEALEQILAEQAIDFVFQPIVRATHRQVVGFEAFCRPKHPAVRSPVELFETALQLGVIWELGRAGRRRLAERIAELPADALVFVNLHPAEVSDPQLLEGEPSLQRYARRIVFEIPLRAAQPSPQRFREQIRALRRYGYGLALDEIGSGYGRLSCLELYKPQYLKLGPGITAGIEDSTLVLQLLQRFRAAARSAQAELVCERLESASQVKAATRAGADLLQGFALGEPEPASSGRANR